MLTDYHAKYYAHELLRRCPSDSLERFTTAIMDSKVDLNPHQVEAALFAFRSPLSKGAILADEVGLGKTIEAGIVLSQKWAEKKRKILIVLPSSLRKQWHQELQEKFYLPSLILESKNFNKELKDGNSNPFDVKAGSPEIVICSYFFARNKAEFIRKINWDLVVVDEAHRLRNVYKTGNKIARELKRALEHSPKLLLTATPLQNSLLELYGLVSFIDEHTFGDLKSFRNQFAKITSDECFDDLKHRIKPLCQRTLRRQVKEYISYTERRAHTQEFIPTQDEEVLYELVSEYLRRPDLQALPPSQRNLMTLVLRKLLASSTFAIAGALEALATKLEKKLKNDDDGRKARSESYLEEDFEAYDELADEMDIEGNGEDRPLTEEERGIIRNEIDELKSFFELSMKISENAKGQSMLQALKTGFRMTTELGGAEKAIIFTESRRTQNYLLKLLAENGYSDDTVLFNGSNNDEKSRRIYSAWKKRFEGTDRVTGSATADTRAALVDYFREKARIMIATEAAAEGINLQFCSLVVNYDLPWNPQRIEQRIGRCHRYGQKHDVVVVNFINKNNAADQRVYELLSEKFKLFSGVFGASDEVLGTIESGVDFEKRIAEIYQTCRTQDEIQHSFDALQAELSSEIDENMKQTRKMLLEHFDEEVHEKLRVNMRESTAHLNKFEARLWELTKHCLKDHADFLPDQAAFILKKNPFAKDNAPTGLYKMGKNITDAHVYRIGHPLSRNILKESSEKELPESEIIFNYSGQPLKISILEPLIGKSGYLSLTCMSVESFEAEDHLVFSANTDEGDILEADQAQRLFSLPGESRNAGIVIPSRKQLEDLCKNEKMRITDTISARNSIFFDEEMEKMEKWADDLKNGLETELKELDREIKFLKSEAKKILKLDEKLKAQKSIKEMEKRRSSKRRLLFEAQDEIDRRKETLIEEVEQRLKQQIRTVELFAIKWKLV